MITSYLKPQLRPCLGCGYAHLTGVPCELSTDSFNDSFPVATPVTFWLHADGRDGEPRHGVTAGPACGAAVAIREFNGRLHLAVWIGAVLPGYLDSTNHIASPIAQATELVLSLFPGVGLLDRSFRAEGFCVCEAPDLITGGDVREFAGVPGRFDGLIAGPPCQGFSVANAYRKDAAHPSVINSREMLRQTCRIILECEPTWFLVENVPGVPDVRIDGYQIQRVPITDFECGGVQLRSRHVQFGSRHGDIIRPNRVNDCSRNRKKGRKPEALTTKTRRHMDFPDHCRRQGFETIELPGWTKTAKAKAVGNGVPRQMGRVLAAAVMGRAPRDAAADCQCGCGRRVSARAMTATDACRKRKQLVSVTRPWVDVDGYHDA